MSFLPIVDRELRVASRRWLTYLTRAGVGTLAIVISVPVMFFGWMTGGGSGAGQSAFTVLSNYIFLVGMLGGVLITADCLSSEKRDGTLGLLFLTDLKGYDVVLGKFAALGLHSMYGLVAVFPALALPLLTGGVTGAEFWRVSFALLNLLFFSLAVGMAVSSMARDASRAFSGTVLILLLFIVCFPLLGKAMQVAGWDGLARTVVWFNPGHAFSIGKATSVSGLATEYWASLGFSHGIAWLLLAGASLVVPRAWQDKATDRPATSGPIGSLGSRIARIFRAQRSRELLEINPVVWLMGDRRVLKSILWIICAAWCAGVLLTCLMLKPENAMGMVFGWCLVVLLVYGLLLIDHACRFWVESRQNGNLEALLAVPIESREILSSHWASIRRHFLWPRVVVLCAATLPTWIVGVQTLLSHESSKGDMVGGLFLYAYLIGFMLWVLSTYIAIGYTGMWLALKLKRPQFASGLTLLCVLILPMMLCWLGFGITLVFIFLPMSLLQSNLRGMILQRYMPVVKGIQVRANQSGV